MSTLVERIQHRLAATGKTASSVADEIGANRSLVRDILIGKSRSPSLDTVKALCRPLDCTLAYLVGIESSAEELEQPPLTKFWMVYGLGQREPTRRHLAFRLASDEAQRLAALNPGITFTVLEAVHAFQAEKPRILSIDVRESDDLDDQIPF